MGVVTESGRAIRHYRILGRLGAGGMGVIYKAEDTKLGRTVALKFLPPELTRDDSAKQRFLIEARAASQLDHPNICTVHEVGESEDGQLYIAMSLYDGETLRERIARGPLPLPEAIDIVKQVARGLAKAHAAGMIHRDIKPANIMVTSDGLVKILDFGLAKLSDVSVTKSHTSVGTAAYMSPEQVRGEKSTPATDVWALGAVACEMLTGKRPFRGDYEQAVIYSILNEEPQPLDEATAGDLAPLIPRMLAKDPAARIQNAQELLTILGEASVTQPVSTPTVRTRPNLKLVAALSLVVLIAAIALGVFLRRTSVQRPAATAVPPIAPKVMASGVAVLPFANFSGPDEDYFVDGIQDAVIGELARFQDLRVLSRTSTASFRNSGKPAAEIAKALNASEIVEGSAVKSGDRVRVQVKLIRTEPEERQVWAETYERPTTDVLVLYSEIASAVARQIDARLTTAAHPVPRKVDPELYKLYLKGIFFRKKETPDAFRTAISYLRQANDIDPTDPLPYVALADTYVAAAHNPGGNPEDLKLAKAAAREALKLDPESADAYGTLAMVKQYDDWEWSGLEEDYRNALRLNPSNAELRRHFAWFLLLFKRYDEAIAEMRRSRDTDPLAPLYTADLGWIMTSSGKPKEGLVEALRAYELEPNAPLVLQPLGRIYLANGRMAEAIAIGRKLASMNPRFKPELGRILATAGHREEALKIAEEARDNKDPWSILGVAGIYVALKDKEQTIRWLYAARDARTPWAPWLVRKAEPLLGNDPRYLELLKSINLTKEGFIPARPSAVRPVST